MTKMTSSHSGQAVYFDITDETGIGTRFLEGFSQFLEEEKEKAVVTLLREEFPHLSDDENFIKQVVENLDEEIIEEKRFVFLSINPLYRK